MRSPPSPVISPRSLRQPTRTQLLKRRRRKKYIVPLYWHMGLLCHTLFPGSLVRDTFADPKCQTTSGDVTFPSDSSFKSGGTGEAAGPHSEMSCNQCVDPAVEVHYGGSQWDRAIAEAGSYRWWWVIGGRLKAEAGYLIWWPPDTERQPSSAVFN